MGLREKDITETKKINPSQHWSCCMPQLFPRKTIFIKEFKFKFGFILRSTAHSQVRKR
jgi:hypothetical protein